MKKIVASFLVLTASLLVGASTMEAQDIDIPAQHAIAVEVETGKILYEKNARQPVATSALSQLLTVYLVYEAIAAGDLSMDSMVSISDYPYYLTGDLDIANVNLDARYYSVNDLLTATLLSSANSPAIALAEAVAGNEAEFVTLMEQTLAKWGVTDAQIVNASGLSNEWLGDNKIKGEDTAENQLSARSLAIIARRLVLDYPEVLDITSKTSYQLNGYTYYATNQFLPDLLYGRSGVDGLKTGWSEQAGSSLITSSYQQKMRVLTVILKAEDGENNPDSRFLAANQLLNYAYDQYSLVTLVPKGEAYHKSSVPVFNGQTANLTAHTTQDLRVVIRKYAGEEVTANFRALDQALAAPVKKGVPLGSLTLVDDQETYLDTIPSVDMVAGSSMKPASWPASWWNHFVKYVNEKL